MEQSEEWLSGRKYLDMSLTLDLEQRDEEVRKSGGCELANAV